MVKPKFENETKEQKFKRIATTRTRRILEDLRLLGNCANRGAYAYTKEDVNKIFAAIESEAKRIRTMFGKPNREFKL